MDFERHHHWELHYENRGVEIKIKITVTVKHFLYIFHSIQNILCFCRMIVGMKNDAPKLRTVILQELVSELKIKKDCR